jgi:microsomal epoxide hydrolase
MSPVRAIAATAALLVALVTLACGPARAADRWFTTSDGVRLHYIEAGRGRTIVLVPGWTMPAWIFEAQIADFSRSFHVVALDPRGQGESDIASSGYEQDRRGQDISELIRHVSRDPVLLVGWSLGVLDSLAYLHSDGDTAIAGLVLVDNSVGEDPPPPPPKHPMHASRHLPRDVMMRNFVRGMFRNPQPPAYLAQLTDTCLRTPERAAAELLEYPVPRTYWKEAVYSTARPVLYIVTPRLAGQAENLRLHHPAAESVVLQGVGHALFVDDAPRFNALVRDFIGRRVWP